MKPSSSPAASLRRAGLHLGLLLPGPKTTVAVSPPPQCSERDARGAQGAWGALQAHPVGFRSRTKPEQERRALEHEAPQPQGDITPMGKGLPGGATGAEPLLGSVPLGMGGLRGARTPCHRTGASLDIWQCHRVGPVLCPPRVQDGDRGSGGVPPYGCVAPSPPQPPRGWPKRGGAEERGPPRPPRRVGISPVMMSKSSPMMSQAVAMAMA